MVGPSKKSRELITQIDHVIEQYITFDLKQKMEEKIGYRLDFEELAKAYKGGPQR